MSSGEGWITRSSDVSFDVEGLGGASPSRDAQSSGVAFRHTRPKLNGRPLWGQGQFGNGPWYPYIPFRQSQFGVLGQIVGPRYGW